MSQFFPAVRRRRLGNWPAGNNLAVSEVGRPVSDRPAVSFGLTCQRSTPWPSYRPVVEIPGEGSLSISLFCNETMLEFVAKRHMGKHKQSIDTKILARIRGKGRGWVFTPSSFLDLGSRVAVASALMRHKQAETIRQLARGLYDYPRTDPDLGLLTPTVDAIANALKGRDAVRLQSSGAYAANLLGLSDQVPMKVVFLTDGPTRTVRIGNQQVTLKRTTPRNMATAGKVSGVVIQALRWLGQRHIDDTVVWTLRNRLSDGDKSQLMRDAPYAPGWIRDVIHQVTKNEED